VPNPPKQLQAKRKQPRQRAPIAKVVKQLLKEPAVSQQAEQSAVQRSVTCEDDSDDCSSNTVTPGLCLSDVPTTPTTICKDSDIALYDSLVSTGGTDSQSPTKTKLKKKIRQLQSQRWKLQKKVQKLQDNLAKSKAFAAGQKSSLSPNDVIEAAEQYLSPIQHELFKSQLLANKKRRRE
jgi:hypothetical protein